MARRYPAGLELVGNGNTQLYRSPCVQRRPKSLFASLLAIGMAGPIVLALGIAALQSYEQSLLVSRWVETELRETGAALASDPNLLVHTQQSAREARIRLMLLDENGMVISDTSGSSAGTSVRDEPDVYLARTVQRGSHRETKDRVDTTYFCQALSIKQHPVSYLRISCPTFALTDPSSGSNVPGQLIRSIWFWLLTLAYSLSVALTVWYLVKRIRKPLLKATSALTNLGDLSWEPRLDDDGRGEVADLGAAFNRAVGTIGSEFTRLEIRSRELEQSARFLETVLGAMIEGVIVVDARQAVSYANAAAATLLSSRFQPAQMTGRQLLEVARHQLLDQTVRALFSGQDRIRVELELSASHRTLSLFATRLSGPAPGAVLVMHDITELRRLERLRREFVSNVSHELKTPLAAIVGYVETLLDGAAQIPETRDRFLKGIETQSQRLHRMIQDLLKLARIESGNEAFELTDVPVNAEIHGVIETIRSLAEVKRVQIDFKSEGVLIVRADRKGFQTIIENLLTNAIKYSSEDSIVRVSTLSDGQGFARIDVADSGIGIAPEHQTRIFERFYRVDEARSRDVGGTGLGLAIVKHLCQVFGGNVAVKSDLNKGSTFTVMLPLAK